MTRRRLGVRVSDAVCRDECPYVSQQLQQQQQVSLRHVAETLWFVTDGQVTFKSMRYATDAGGDKWLLRKKGFC